MKYLHNALQIGLLFANKVLGNKESATLSQNFQSQLRHQKCIRPPPVGAHHHPVYHPWRHPLTLSNLVWFPESTWSYSAINWAVLARKELHRLWFGFSTRYFLTASSQSSITYTFMLFSKMVNSIKSGPDLENVHTWCHAWVDMTAQHQNPYLCWISNCNKLLLVAPEDGLDTGPRIVVNTLGEVWAPLWASHLVSWAWNEWHERLVVFVLFEKALYVRVDCPNSILKSYKNRLTAHRHRRPATAPQLHRIYSNIQENKTSHKVRVSGRSRWSWREGECRKNNDIPPQRPRGIRGAAVVIFHQFNGNVVKVEFNTKPGVHWPRQDRLQHTLVLITSTCCRNRSRAAITLCVRSSFTSSYQQRSLYYCLFAPLIYGDVLRVHPVRGESHIQRNANREVATTYTTHWCSNMIVHTMRFIKSQHTPWTFSFEFTFWWTKKRLTKD